MQNRIKKILESENITMTRMAEILHISQSMVSLFCRGKNEPSERTIADICREFRINETWLRNGEGEMYQSFSKQDQLKHFFDDVLTTAPDARSDCLAAMAKLPPEFWGMLTECAREIVSNLDTEKRQEKPLTLPKVAARGAVDQDALDRANTDIQLPDMESDIIP